MASSSRGHEPHWWHITGARHDGKPIHFEAKVFYYRGTGHLYWELRRVVMYFCERVGIKRFELSRMLKKQRATWLALFAPMEIDEEVAIQKSAKAHLCSASATLAEGSSGLVRDEWTISTQGLVGLLLAWAVVRRGDDGRQYARAMLTALLARHATGVERVGAMACRLWRNAQLAGVQCDAATEHQETCMHCAAIPSRPTPGAPAEFIQLVCRFVGIALVCKAAAAVIREFSQEVAESEARGGQTEDALGHTLLKWRGKLRRVDEHFKQRMVVEQVRNGQARSARDVVAATRQASKAASERWTDNLISSSVMGAWKRFGEAPLDRVCSIAEDAARIGNTGEETEVYSLWSQRHGEGLWLAPQASCGQSVTSLGSRSRRTTRARLELIPEGLRGIDSPEAPGSACGSRTSEFNGNLRLFWGLPPPPRPPRPRSILRFTDCNSSLGRRNS